MGDLKCHECGKALDRPYQPGTLPTCTSCVKKFLSKVMDTTWFGEPKRIKRKRKSIQDLGFEPALINKVSKIGRVYKRAIQLEQCNPLETDPLTRFGLLTENKIKPGFNPVIVEGLDVEIDIEQKDRHVARDPAQGIQCILVLLSIREETEGYSINSGD